MQPLLILASFILFFAQSGATAQDADQDHTFLSGGVTIAYSDIGEGAPVVVLHGMTGNRKQWSLMYQVLNKAGYRVLAPDARGHGESEKPHDVKAYGAKMAEDVVALLDHKQIKRAHIVGYSMGGDTANKVRERYPDRLLSVTIGGAGRGVTKGWAAGDFDYLDLARSLERGEGFKAILRLPDALRKGTASAEEVDAVNSTLMKGQDARALAALIRAYPELEVSEDSLRDNTVPTLMIVGEHDPERPTVEMLNGIMKRLQIVVLPGRNHLTALQDEQVLLSTLKFMRQHGKK